MRSSYDSAYIGGSLQYLFVYGTLRSDSDHHMHKALKGKAACIGAATVQGRLYMLGAFPGMVAAETLDESVHGELYRLYPGCETLLNRLDCYEGFYRNRPASSLFVRRLVRAQPLGRNSQTAKTYLAWTYLYNASTSGASQILSGDYGKFKSTRAKA